MRCARRSSAGLAVLLIAAAGCDTFRPRRPEAPLGPPLSVSYAAPESTLDTMKRGVEDRTQQGINAYVNALADSTKDNRSFYAIMDPTALSRWQQINPGRTPPDVWSVDRERNFISVFVNAVIPKSTCTMEWLPGLFPDQSSSNQVVLFRKYLVTTYSTESGEPDDTLAVGYATLTITQVSPARWAVTRWEDQIDVENDQKKPNWQSFSERRLATY